MDDTTRKALVEKIAAAMPPELVEEIASEALKKTLDNLRWTDDALVKLVNEAVVARARELLATKYKDELEKKAEMLAANMVRTMGQMVLPDRGRFG